MDAGVVPPCSDLGQSSEHRVLTWVSRKANKDGLVMLRPDKVTYRVYREAHVEGDQPFTHLEDGGWLEKVRTGESFRWKVLVTCSCSIDLLQNSPPATASVATVPWHRSGASVLGYNSSTGSSSGYVSLRVKSESAQNSVSLARDIFPRLVKQNPLQANWPALAKNLKLWNQQGVEWSFIRQMMEEFAQHPEWCRRSRRSPWLVFVSKRSDLSSLVSHQRQKATGLRQRPSQSRGRILERSGSYYTAT
jgi:hypothetical protein